MKNKKIRIKYDGKEVLATVFGNPASEDFLSLLPLKLNLKDYAATEKVAYLSRKLDVSGSPDGSKPFKGHIAYYAPWGNLAIFYKDFEYSKGLVLLGEIDQESILDSWPSSLNVEIESL